jgi:hypothetical protein
MNRLLRYLIASALICGLVNFASLFAQQTEDLANLEMLHIVKTPTAGCLKKGQYQVDFLAYGQNGMSAGIGIGLFDRFMFGISFGGNQLLGYDEPDWNELPGMSVRYRLIEETNTLPAITIGYDAQGHGAWDGTRYLYKSPGAFAAASRNFISDMGRFGIHGGVNSNTFEDDGDRSTDFFAGVDFSLNEQLVVLAEYDFALDDNKEDNMYGEGKEGYLNVGLQFSFAQSFVVILNLTDLMNNSVSTPGIGRELKFVYVETF